jgi:hypothetical protein
MENKGECMPCAGPGENKEGAENAIKEFAVLLKTKYQIDIDKEETYGMCSKQINFWNKKMKEAIYELFKYDSWNGF